MLSNFKLKLRIATLLTLKITQVKSQVDVVIALSFIVILTISGGKFDITICQNLYGMLVIIKKTFPVTRLIESRTTKRRQTIYTSH